MLHVISSAEGLSATISTIGASLVSLVVPGQDGTPVDVVLGFEHEDDYRDNPCFFGATVGRCVNRIAGARFSLGDKEYRLTANDGANCNHSGRDFWAMRPWEVAEADDAHVALALHSPSGDQGFPGAVDATATYRLAGNALEVTYAATTSEPTIVNMTNHAYYNLNGHDSGLAMAHELSIDANSRLVSDETVLPTGDVAVVANTAWDWAFSGLLDNVFSEPDAAFSQCAQIRHTGALLIGTYDNFTRGDPAGFLRNINSHMPTARQNKLLFIEKTGHTYQQKQQEVADKILAQLQEWRDQDAVHHG